MKDEQALVKDRHILLCQLSGAITLLQGSRVHLLSGTGKLEG